MDVNLVLYNLITRYKCLPAIKLMWDCQIDLCMPELPGMPPSLYIQELSMTTDERYALLEKQHRRLENWTPETELTVVPTIVVFQSYAAGESQSVNLTIRNISRNSQKVTLLMDEDGPFSIDKKSKRIAQFPSGMSFNATIKFKAEDDKFYYHKLIFVTKTSRFVIPIIAMGGRGMLDAPDRIDLGRVPVKYLHTKTIPVCNIGDKTARFTFITDGPFSVSPEKGVVISKDSFNLMVSFCSDSCVKAQGGLRIKYENGEEVYVTLIAEAVNELIGITPLDLEFQDTYTGLQNKLVITITNGGETNATFKWRKYISDTAAQAGIQHVHHHAGGGDTGQADQTYSRLYSHGDSIVGAKLLPAHGDSILPRDTEQLYSDSSFAVEPPMGVIPPHCSADVYVFFSPMRTGMYISEVFCDITGLEERTEVRITGRGLGPKFKLGFAELDIGTIFVGGGHTYEIPVTNTSEIEGAIIFDSVAGMMPKSNVQVEPAQVNLAPGHYSAFYMFFHCSGRPGEFYEEIRFKVPVTEQIISLTVRGRISFPEMHFSTKLLAFGNVSYGFPKTVQVVVINDSLNHVDLSLHLDKDGTEPALEYEDILATFTEDSVNFPEDTQEFVVEPREFQLTPRGFQRVSVTLTCGSYGDYDRKLLVCTEDNDIINSIIIKGKCYPPTLIKADAQIFLKNTYRHVPYHATLHVHNPTDIYGIFCCIPKSGSIKMKLESNDFIGVANPKTTTEIPFSCTCSRAGEQVGHIELYIAGMEEPVMEFEIKCHVVSAAFVDLSTRLIHIGSVEVGELGLSNFEIINKCSQLVPFYITVAKSPSTREEWQISPQDGSINPKGKFRINIEVKMVEAGDFSCIVRVFLNDGQTFLDVKVKAKGTGCSLGICPPIDRSGKIDFGSLFLKTYKSFTYEITNHGHLDKMMEWRHEKDGIPNTKAIAKTAPVRLPLAKRGPAPATKKEIEPPKKPTKTVFEIEPMIRLLHPGEKMKAIIKTYAPVAKHADEAYILWAYTPKVIPPAKNEDLAKTGIVSHVEVVEDTFENKQSYEPVPVKHVHLVGMFERAALEFSSRDLLFKVESSPTQSVFQIKNEIHILNKCTLPLKAEFKTEFPFSMNIKGHPLPPDTTALSHVFEAGETINMLVNFDGSHLRKDKGSLYFESQLEIVYVGVPGQETIRLRGEVHFPGVEVDRNYIDFGVVLNGTEAVQEFTVTNKSSYCLTYKVYIKPKSTVITKKRSLSPVPSIGEELEAKKKHKGGGKKKSPSAKSDSAKSKSPQSKIKSPTSKSKSPTSKSKSPKSKSKSPKSKSKSPKSKSKSPKIFGRGSSKSKSKSPKGSRTKARDPLDAMFPITTSEVKFVEMQEKPSAAGSNDSEELLYDHHAHHAESELAVNLDQSSELVQFLREKMYRAKFMYMMGLHEPDREVDDELTYLQYFPVKPTTVNRVAPAELIDIVPMAGVLQAGQSQRFTAVFYAKLDISFKTVLCFYIEGGTPAYITVTGHSSKAPPLPVYRVTSEELREDECRPKVTLHQQEVDHKIIESCAMRSKNSYKFSTPVRKKVTRVVPVTNKTRKREVLNPNFAGRFFHGEEVISIPPMSTYDFTVTYHPLEMTRTCKERHTGSVYFLMSSGAITLYNFIGLATSPESEGQITIEVQARAPWTEKLPVKNWLDHSQHFIVKNEILSHNSSSHGGLRVDSDLHEFLFLVGHETIDVPAHASKDYLLHFIAYREGSYAYRIIFTNKINEFLYYDLTFKVTTPDILETIHFSTVVREKVSHDIVLENPLQIEALIRSQTTVHGVRVIPRKTTIHPKSKTTLKVECFPLLRGPFVGVVEFISPELGLYPYQVEITCEPAPPEETTYFNTTLSVPFKQLLRITNHFTAKLDFKIDLNSNAFSVKENFFTVDKRTQMKLEVDYDPCALGISTTTLTATSGMAGIYEFPLHGTCAPPRPEGSFLLRDKLHTTIHFKNPLLTKASFYTNLDAPFFLLPESPKTFDLKSKQTIALVVGVQHVKAIKPPSSVVPATVRATTSVAKSKSKKGNAKAEAKAEAKAKKEKPVPVEIVPPKIIVTELPESVVIDESWEDFVVGQLVVTCNTVPGEDGKEGPVKWVYYLQGILSDKMKSRTKVAVPRGDSAKNPDGGQSEQEEEEEEEEEEEVEVKKSKVKL